MIARHGPLRDPPGHGSGRSGDSSLHPRVGRIRKTLAQGRGHRGEPAANVVRQSALRRSHPGYEDGEPVGFALFFHNYSTFLGRPGIYLEDLFVDPDRRGRGYGKALLAHLARLARDRDCGRVEWAVLDWNAPSIQFYKSLGAVSLDDWIIFRLTGEALERSAR